MKSLDNMTEPELREVLQRVGERVKFSLPKDTGFIVLATPFGQGGISQYVSNARRKDAIKWMREAIARFEAADFIPRVGD